ncbi:MAG: hypothetical protein H7Z14_20530 [Anaerolineae bacterium]|nr:hypothetical protein [Phycisphaerae bacterium]
MEPKPPADNPAFPVTQWSLIDRVAATTSAQQRTAVGVLLQRYLPALRAHLVYERRVPADRADDLLQSFVSSKVLEQRLIDRSDRLRGKFRTFLIGALRNFLIDQHREATAAKRQPQDGSVAPIEAGIDVPDDADAPSDAFDREWAKQALTLATDRMRKDCQRWGKNEVWGVFEARILRPSIDGAEPESYESLLARFKLTSSSQASNVLMTGKRMFTRYLRDVVGEYATGEDQVDEELADLRRILGT